MINKAYEVVTDDDKVVSTDNVVSSLTDEGDAAVTGVLFEGVLLLFCVVVVVCFVVVVVGLTGDIVVVV